MLNFLKYLFQAETARFCSLNPKSCGKIKLPSLVEMGSVCFFFFCFHRQTAFPLDLECGVRIYSISLYVFNNNAIKHGSLFLPLHKIHTFHYYDFPIMYKSLFAYILSFKFKFYLSHTRLYRDCITSSEMRVLYFPIIFVCFQNIIILPNIII